MDCCRRVNPFRACSPLRGLGYLMLAFVAAIVAVSYYAVVVYTWGPLLLGGGGAAAGAAAVLVAFHLLKGKVHKNIVLAAKMASRLVVIIVLFVYTFVETVLDTLVLLPYFIEFFRDESRRSSSPGDIAILFITFVLNLAFALSLLCFIGMHASLVTSNTTSIEVHERRNSVSWKYDLGWRKNLEQVFGTKKLLWFLPLYSAEDLHNIGALHGLEFPTRSDAVA
uniref:Protein S-acyltransferase n=1 Tax=Oryza barthii TaxID=65489 RepID=A0A0D3GQS1_9ORYZ